MFANSPHRPPIITPGGYKVRFAIRTSDHYIYVYDIFNDQLTSLANRQFTDYVLMSIGGDYIALHQESDVGAKLISSSTLEDIEDITETPFVGATEVSNEQPVLSLDGKYLAYYTSISGTYYLNIKNLQTNTVKSKQVETEGTHSYLRFSPDGQYLTADMPWSFGDMYAYDANLNYIHVVETRMPSPAPEAFNDYFFYPISDDIHCYDYSGNEIWTSTPISGEGMRKIRYLYSSEGYDYSCVFYDDYIYIIKHNTSGCEVVKTASTSISTVNFATVCAAYRYILECDDVNNKVYVKKFDGSDIQLISTLDLGSKTPVAVRSCFFYQRGSTLYI